MGTQSRVRFLTQGRCVLVTQHSENPSTLVPSRAASRPVKPRRVKARALRRCDQAFQMKLDGLPCAVHRGLRRSKLHPNELQRLVWGNLLGDRTACSHGRELEMEEQEGLPGPSPSSALAAQPPSTAPVLQSGLASQKLTALSQFP